MLKVDPTYPSRRTFVLKLHRDATPEALFGRLENLTTCRHHDFTSERELLDLITRDIETADSEATNDS